MRASFAVRRPTGLPPSTWLVEMTPDGTVLHAGERVEVDGDWFFEGVFAGPFTRSGLERAPYRAGSGGVLTDRGWRFLTPSHPLEPVYCFVARDEPLAWVSNSFTCVLGVVGIEPSVEEYAGLIEIARDMKEGITDYSRKLHETERGVLFRYAFFPFDLPRFRSSPREIPDVLGATPFRDYRGYAAHLTAVLRDLAANGRDRRRGARHDQLLGTCSAGYDSPASALLARTAGLRRVVTLTDGRGGAADNGEEIARILGLDCRVGPRLGTDLEKRIDNDHYVDPSLLPAQVLNDLMPFFASPETVEDIFFAAFRDELPGTILFTGFMGGGVWGLKDKVGPQMNRLDNSGAGLDEPRKRLGFAHVPVPTIAGRHIPVIKEISRSAEMKPYRIGGWYDRPIPRRLLEEAGVPREMFGHIKGRASVLFEKSSLAPLPPEGSSEEEVSLHRSTLEVRQRAIVALAADYRRILGAG